MNDNQKHVKWFRDSSPYINAHRGKTFVLHLGGEAIEHENFTNIVADIALLNSLGVQLVLVHGATPQLDRYLTNYNIESETTSGIRVTTPRLLTPMQHVIGKIRIDLEAVLSRGIVNTPIKDAEMDVTSGNYIKAKPLGIIDGVDFHHTGKVRKVKAHHIKRQLEQGAITIVSPMGYSPSGEVFNIDSKEVACEVAIALQADKLILFGPATGIFDEKNKLVNELEVSAIDTRALKPGEPLGFAVQACIGGVKRCHLISFVIDGALLEELLTRDGTGTQVTRHSYEEIRVANANDVAGLIKLIAPLEEEGILVKRSRELIESEIDKFIVIDRDGMIVSCAALYPFNHYGELACLATHPDYRDNNRGELLLKAIEKKALEMSLTSIFVLTTQSAHWFTERGFVERSLTELPRERQLLYNYQRNSKLLEKPLP